MKSDRKQTLMVLAGSLLALTTTLGSSLAMAEEKEAKQLPIEDVQRFSTAISQIKSYYVKPTNDKDLFEDAIRGMLVGLDPHSTYLDEEDFKELRATTKGEFSGLGIEVTMEDGLIKVISPIDDTPAALAGIKSGDLIVKLDETPVKGMTLRDAVNKMRGKRGSAIKLLIVRKGETKPLVITVVRDTVQVQSVKSRMYDDKYGYIRISHFQAPTAKDLEKAVSKLMKQASGHLEGLILDMRNNPGGLLDSAIKVSDAFIHNDSKGKEEMIVYTKGRLPGSEFTAMATPGDILKNAPIVVLINEGSASGSEIVAGALKDNKRAVIVGTQSFGKGSVQTVLPLDENRGIKLTTALYYTPSGNSIQAKGITPDIVINSRKIDAEKGGEKKNLLSLSEADLSGHLDNGNKTDKTAKKEGAAIVAKDKKAAASTKGLVYKDYQLFQAINILKGISLLDDNK